MTARRGPLVEASDFARDLGRLETEIARLEAGGQPGALEGDRSTGLIGRLYQRATLTGDPADLEAVTAATVLAIERSPRATDLHAVKAHLDFTRHRFDDVRRDLETDPALRDSAHGRALQADLDFQAGRYEEARRGYDAAVREDRTWDHLARRAAFEARLGDIEAADRLYIEAEDLLTAKEMRPYAWLELQRGLLDLMGGRHLDARKHYTRSGRAYSGHWLADEHMAELLGAEERYEDARLLYEQVIARVPRPEVAQALGELSTLLGRHEEAGRWHARAIAGYLASAAAGAVHYYHHLADFYADVREDGPEAVTWARRDIALRENFSTQAALAWALHTDGQVAPALATMTRALSSGVRDARIFAQAAAIHVAAGRTGEGEAYRQRAAAINPHHERFHVHR